MIANVIEVTVILFITFFSFIGESVCFGISGLRFAPAQRVVHLLLRSVDEPFGSCFALPARLTELKAKLRTKRRACRISFGGLKKEAAGTDRSVRYDGLRVFSVSLINLMIQQPYVCSL
jgi:hypothetical protein